MTTLAVRAPSETSRCPRCAYHHSGPKGQLCPTCVAIDLAGGAAKNRSALLCVSSATVSSGALR